MGLLSRKPQLSLSPLDHAVLRGEASYSRNPNVDYDFVDGGDLIVAQHDSVHEMAAPAVVGFMVDVATELV